MNTNSIQAQLIIELSWFILIVAILVGLILWWTKNDRL
jgi:uncharacterized iron-regulated membrane protein